MSAREPRLPLGRLLVLAALGLLPACGGEAPPTGPVAVERAPFPTRPVVREALAALLAEVPDPVIGDLPTAEADQELVGEVHGLVTFLSSATGGLVDAAFDDIQRLGDPAVPVLLSIFHDEERIRDERRSALRLLGSIETPTAALALTREMADNDDPALRALAAWKLEGHPEDLAVGPLLKRIKYESDASVVPWIARALASHGNYAGVEPLRVLVEWYGSGSEAAGHLVSLAEEAGFEASLAGAAELEATWLAADPDGRLPTPAVSPRRELDAWRWIAGLADFQLRGVDDGRFVLVSYGTWVTPLLAEALHDEDQYVRLHVAQALQRRGPRAAVALPDLVAALAEPGLAPTAAGALGALGNPAAEAALVACLGPVEPAELRVAAARALGELGRESSVSALEALLAAPAAGGPKAFPELEQAVVESLVRLGLDSDLPAATTRVPDLLRFSRDRFLDATTSMRVLREWIGAAAEAELEQDPEPESPGPAVTLRDAWDALAPDPFTPATPAEAAERRASRLALVEAALAD
ncbi:MAG: hypothetical protein P1V81_11975 [Planctomycetota bacterium]|nr:hypothetical protein [Planctomycetota bacterium]